MKHLLTCRPKDVPQHAQKILITVTASRTAEFVSVLQKRMVAMTGARRPVEESH
jgi:hypothetical protein